MARKARVGHRRRESSARPCDRCGETYFTTSRPKSLCCSLSCEEKLRAERYWHVSPCAGCGEEFRQRRVKSGKYLKRCQACQEQWDRGKQARLRERLRADPERLAAYRRQCEANRHKRRAAVSAGDVDAEYLAFIRQRTTHCPLCLVEMLDEAGQTSSKEVDHIVPLCIGGLHARSNLRVICASCNRRRPKNGDDLWFTPEEGASAIAE